MINKLLFIVMLCLSPLAEGKSLDFNKWYTHHGMAVYHVHSTELPMIDLTLAFRAGSARDGTQPGLAALTNALLEQGSGQLDATELAKAFESVGAQLSTQINRDTALINLRTLSDQPYAKQAIEHFMLTISQPQLTTKALTRLKQQMLAKIAQTQQSPHQLAEQAFYQHIYRQTPYEHSIIGTPATLANITQQAIKDFYKQHYVASNAVLVIVGAIDAKRAKTMAETISSRLPKGQPAPPLTLNPQAIVTQKTIDFPSQQTTIKMGQLAIKPNASNYYALQVGNYVLGGGGFCSRLVKTIRINHGLAYNVGSSFIPLAAGGPFIISLSTNRAPKALALLHTTLAQYLQEGPTDEEVTLAKQFLIGNFALKLDSHRQLARALIDLAIYDLPDDFYEQYPKKIAAVTLTEVKQQLQRTLNPQQMVTIMVGHAQS